MKFLQKLKDFFKKIWTWIDNIWYLRKWEILIAVFFIVVIGICVAQMIRKEEPDAYILYAGPAHKSTMNLTAMSEVFSYIMPADNNGDGKKWIEIMSFFLVDESVYNGLLSEEAQGQIQLNYGLAELQQERTSYTNAVMASDAVLYLLDPAQYESLKGQDALEPIAEAIGADSIPDYALDAYGIRFADTEFAQYFSVFEDLPSDTVLCIRALTTQTIFRSKAGDPELRAQQYELLRGILNFTFPEGYRPPEKSPTDADVPAISDTVISETDAAA